MKLHLNDGSLVDFAKDENIAFDLEDLLLCLARERRFSNKADWTVLQHSIAVGVAAENMYEGNQILICRAYTHDLCEAVIRDVPTPIKNAVGDGWWAMENMVQDKIEKCFDIAKPSKGDEELMQNLDKAMLLVEALHLLPENVVVDLKEKRTFDPITLIHASTAFLVVAQLPMFADETMTSLSEEVKDKYREILTKGHI